MKNLLGLLLFISTALYSHALGYETYTPSELKAMIARGEYPKQSSAGQKKSSVTMGFEKCKLSTDTVLNQLGRYYPKEVIISTSIIHTSKMWANDGTISITCSKLDNKMIIVESKYEGREIYKNNVNSREAPAKAASKSPKVLKKLSSDRSYTVQVFSSTFRKNAEDVLTLLREKDFSDAYIHTHINQDNSVLHQVRVGKVPKEEAEDRAFDLRRLDFIDSAQIIRF